MRRRWIPWFLLAGLVSIAALPSGIENQIKSWFSASGGVAISFKERTPPRSQPGACIVYADRTTHQLKVACNGAQFGDLSTNGETGGTVLVADGQGGFTDSGCAITGYNDQEDALLTCGRFQSRDQNLASPGRPNLDGVLGNENNSVAGATCALSGADGELRRLDVNNANGTQEWVVCDGLDETDKYGNRNQMLLPWMTEPVPAAGSQILNATTLTCAPFIPTYTLADATKIAFQLDTGDNTNTRTNICIYDSTKTLIMATSRCAGGSAASNPCSADSDCPSSTCTSVTANVAAQGVVSTTGLRSTQLVQNRLYYLCAASNSTTAAIKTWSNTVPNHTFLNTYGAKLGTAAEDKDGYCPLAITTITSAAVEQPYVLVSAE